MPNGVPNTQRTPLVSPCVSFFQCHAKHSMFSSKSLNRSVQDIGIFQQPFWLPRLSILSLSVQLCFGLFVFGLDLWLGPQVGVTQQIES